MRRTTKNLLFIGMLAAAAVLVAVFKLDTVDAQADSGATYSALNNVKVESRDVADDAETSSGQNQPTAQELLDEKVLEERQALVEEGLKVENRTVTGSDGKVYHSSMAGLCLLDNIKGLTYEPTAGADDASLRQEFYTVAYETDAKKSPMSVQLANNVADKIGAELGASVNVQYGRVSENAGKREVTSSSLPVEGKLMLGIDPKFAGENDTLAVIAIYPGGEYKILEDTDEDPTTLTVDVPPSDSSLVMYSIVKYK